ncbi:GtrA family protein [Mycetocola spongiae]|uniref:GtrA family protein n=1 Tax=Mycetocola spongiae TaxID=2859226 RepID=UPI0021F44182|nr:GtrA family protein [Mycetocola spongiae]
MGGAGLIVTIVTFNLLITGPLAPGVVHRGSIIATIIAQTLAIITNWLGNRFWTFATHRASGTFREGVEFFAVSLVGMGIGTACVWISHDVLGFTSQLADNIALNVVGLALGSIFRFALYRYWVFSPKRRGIAAETASTTEIDTDTGTVRVHAS